MRIAFAFWRRLRRARRRHSRTRASHYIEPARVRTVREFAPFARYARVGAPIIAARAHIVLVTQRLARLARRLAPPTRTPTRHRLSVRALTTPPIVVVVVDDAVVRSRAHTGRRPKSAPSRTARAPTRADAAAAADVARARRRSPPRHARAPYARAVRAHTAPRTANVGRDRRRRYPLFGASSMSARVATGASASSSARIRWHPERPVSRRRARAGGRRASSAASASASASASAPVAASEPRAHDTMSTIQEYIEKHDLSKKVEEALNAAVKARPEEPMAFMVRRRRRRRERAHARARFIAVYRAPVRARMMARLARRAREARDVSTRTRAWVFV
jgi:hypothetical protein